MRWVPEREPITPPTGPTGSTGMDCGALRCLVEVQRWVLRWVESHSRHRARVRRRAGTGASCLRLCTMRDKHPTLPQPRVFRNAVDHEVQLDTPSCLENTTPGGSEPASERPSNFPQIVNRGSSRHPPWTWGLVDFTYGHRRSSASRPAAIHRRA